MTLAVDGVAGRDRAEFTRWGSSLLVVLLLHGAAGLFLLSRQVPLDAGGPPPAAVMIDLAPLPAPSPPQPAPPEPVLEPQLQPQAEPEPPPPPPPEIEMPKVEPSPAPKPAVVLPTKPPPRPKLRPVEHPPEVAPERPPPAAAPAVTAPPAPATAPPAVNSIAIRASWQAQLVGWLERYKRYPRLAQEQRQEGTVYLRFAIDRQGHVLSSQIERGSGHALLDEEVLALVQRAQPLPAPPPEIPGTRIELTVPIQFTLRNGAR
jgi:protein TonB